MGAEIQKNVHVINGIENFKIQLIKKSCAQQVDAWLLVKLGQLIVTIKFIATVNVILTVDAIKKSAKTIWLPIKKKNLTNFRFAELKKMILY